MSQEQIIKFLENNPKQWYTTNEIAEFLNISHRAIKENVRRLIGSNQVQFQHRQTTIQTSNGNLRTVLKLYVKYKKKAFIL